MKDFRFDFLSANTTVNMSTQEKIEHIIDRVKKGNVVILERGLVPEDEMKLIHATLNEVNAKFTGIEVVSLDKHRGKSFKERIINKVFPRSPLTVVGPSTIVKKIKRQPDSFSLWV